MRFRIPIREPLGADTQSMRRLSDIYRTTGSTSLHRASGVRWQLWTARLYVTGLSHVIWLHRSLRAVRWMLFDCVSPVGYVGRGMAIGRVYAPSGDLVASAAQKCLLAPAV
jgi:acyl-CoA thioesterase-2